MNAADFLKLISEEIAQQSVDSEDFIKFENLNIEDDLEIDYDLFSGIRLDKCEFQGGVYLMSHSIDRIVTFSECKFLKGLTIRDVTIEKGVRIERSIIDSGLNFNSIQASAGIHLIGSSIDFLTITSAVIDEILKVENCNIVEFIEISNSEFHALSISGLKSKSLRHIGNQVKNIFEVKKSIFNEFIVTPYGENLSFVNTLSLEDVTTEDLLVSQITVNEINLKRNRIPGGKIANFENLKLNQFLIDRFINSGFFLLHNITGKRTIDNFDTTFHPNDESSFIITNSYLGNTTFTRCGFENFEKIIINDSDLSSISFIGTQNFNPLKIKTNIDNIVPSNDATERRLLFGQLKKAFQTRGDKVAAAQYYALEMNEYKKSLPNSVNYIQEHFMLFLNKASNSFDRNWLQSIIVTLLFSFILLFLYCCSLLGYDAGVTLFYHNWFRTFEF
ncbi:MAG: hypothetical protein IT259_17505, partial [Saprospiraceae bacterium]|nr:hypothetical protein [Saprospiraceae bacterium]